jgi:DNA-directed RNA polymerase specialized sigma24 family protein
MDDFNTLVNSNIYKGITANVCKNHVLKEDLHFESILVIVEKKVDFSEIRDLKHFFAKIVWLTWHSNKFRKKYMNEYIDIAELDDIAENNQVIKYDKIQEKVNDEYNNEHEYYEKNLLRLYVELGNCRAISKQTNIPYRTVANDIQQIKDKLKRQHNEENSN